MGTVVIDPATKLRTYVGETISDGETADDTLFSDDEIQDLLVNHQGPFSGKVEGLYLAASEGWERKASFYANQADHEQGGAKDVLSQLYQQAIAQATRYRSLAYDQRTPRVGRIRRPGTTIT